MEIGLLLAGLVISILWAFLNVASALLNLAFRLVVKWLDRE